jgi:hypothetical protein
MAVRSLFGYASWSAEQMGFAFVADGVDKLASKDPEVAQAFIREVELQATRQDLVNVPETSLFVSVMQSLVGQGNVDLSVELGKACDMGMGNQQVRDVLDEVNDRYVVPAGLEITSHGLLRSFRFWSADEKAAYVAEVRALMYDLSELSANVCLGYGGVLSLVRDAGLNPHDDDLDVLVGFDIGEVPTFGAGVERLREFLESRGWTVCGQWPAFLKVNARSMEADIDVFVVLNEEGTLASIPGPRGKIPWTSIFPAGAIDTFDMPIAIPNAAESYLTFVYGADWKTPKRGWQHSWNYAAYQDIT